MSGWLRPGRRFNADHVPTDTSPGRPAQHKYGQRHDHDKHAHVGWCIHAQTAKVATLVVPRLHKILVSSVKGPMSGRHTCSYRIHIASLPPRNGPSLPILVPHDFRRRGRERCARSLDSGRLTAAPTPACTAESGPVTWSTARTRSPSPRRHVPHDAASAGGAADRRRQAAVAAERARCTARRARWGEHADHRHAHHLPLNHAAARSPPAVVVAGVATRC